MRVAETLFPILAAPEAAPTAATLPLFRDVAWDFKAGRPRFQGGEPVIVEGGEAVLSWAWRALQTARYRYEIYTTDYGCELRALTGQPYREDTKLAEAVRYVREALLQSPYITEVSVTDAAFQGDELIMTCRLGTVYGEGNIRV